MNIRQSLIRRAGALTALMVLLSVAAVSVLAWFGPELGVGPTLAVLLTLAVVPLASVHVWFRCPCCKSGLAPLLGHFGLLRRMSKRVTHCPFCGVEFDRPLAHGDP